MLDEQNPQFLFQGTLTELLVKIASGEIDCKQLAIQELKNRGRDQSGKWIGYNN